MISARKLGTYGLGEGLVSGDITGDEWLFQEKDFELIKRTKGSKTSQYVYDREKSGIQLVPVAEERSSMYCLTPSQAQQVAQSTAIVCKFYREKFQIAHIDTEWAIDSTNQRLYFLQARPVVHKEKTQIQTVDMKSVAPEDVLLTGRYSLLGACHGVVKIIDKFSDLEQGKITIGEQDIVVAVKTGNYFNQFLKHLAGIVTTEGSPTSHPMLIGRERGIPCVIGCPDALEALRPYHGRWVTLDGLKKQVYRGKKPLQAASIEMVQALFDLPKVAPLPADEESIKFLKQFGRALEKDDQLWISNPDYPLSPAWAQWTLDALESRRLALNAADPNSAHFLIYKGIIHNSRVYDLFQPLSDTMKCFDHWQFSEATNFFKNRQYCMDRFTQITREGDWVQYPEAYKSMMAHKWLSWVCFLF